MACEHRKPPRSEWRRVEVSPYGDTEDRLVEVDAEFTYEDLDVGRFRCTQCGEVFYYTGSWRRYHEEGIPCSGSDGVRRVPPKETTAVGRLRPKRAKACAPAAPMVWTRADPEALARFDPRTKVCSMNCGPSTDDPRCSNERALLCDECWEVAP